MKDLVLRKNAFKIATICANVQKGEKVTIVTDFNKVDLAESIASCCLELQAEVVITVMEPRKMHNQKLPEAVAAAMAASDVLFVPTTWSIAHTEARTRACKAGARVINLPALERETLISGAIDLDFVANEPLVKKVADLLTKAKIARVTTDIGTDITMSIEKRDGAALACLSHNPGQFATVPDVEARVTPVEGTANGVIFVDGSIPIPEVGLIQNPIKVAVKDGFATKIEGDAKADAFRKVLEDANDPYAYNIAELGIGMNTCAKLIGVMLEDEGSFGTIHIAVGTSAAFGGKVSTNIHLDMMIRNPILYLDDKPILDRGKLLI